MPITSPFNGTITCGCAALVCLIAATARAGSAASNDTATGLNRPLNIANNVSGETQVALDGGGFLTGADLPAGITDVKNIGVQIASYGGSELIQPPAVYTGRPDQFASAGRGDEGLPIGNWLVFPSSFAGVVFATNPNNDPAGGRASPGLRLRSNTTAQTDDGIKKTLLYSNSDLQFFLNQGSNSLNQGSNSNGGNLNNLTTQTGIIETYQPLSDIIINAQADFTRQIDYFSSVGVTNNLSAFNSTGLPTLNSTGVGIAPSANPLPYNQISGSASVQKDFSNTFVILRGSIVDLTYDSSTITAPSPNGVTFTGAGRGGFWIIPDLYAYLETSIDKRAYATTALSSSGFRSVAGVGSDQMGLFRGELYAGYQAENYASAAVGSAKGPLLGGRGSYFPLPELTINASLDQTIGASLTTSPTSPATTSTKVTSLIGQAKYAIAPEWTLAGSGALALTTYGGSNRRDTAWTVDLSFNYSVWQNFGLAFDIQRTVLNSSVPQTGFTNNVVTLGLSYVY